MLGSSFGSSSTTPHEEEEENPSIPIATTNVYDLHHLHLHHHNRGFASSSPPLHMRQLLISCAELVARSDFSAARRLIAILSSNSSPYGDSTERLVHQFTKALSLRLNRAATATTTTTTTTSFMIPIINPTTTSTSTSTNEEALIQSSYLSLNQVTPFIRFSHLTANQAILEAIDGQQAIHILDFDIMHGVQWPPLMQALAERFPPPTLRITGTGNNIDILLKTGDRLTKFAHSLGLRFQFHPLTNEDPITITSSVILLPNETLAVNCVHYLHHLLNDRDHNRLRLFLHRVKAMCPSVFTMGEREANHNHPLFQQRFLEAVDHYSSVFDSLEATLPPNSRERMAVEQIWFGREIADIVAEEGEGRIERHERFRSWESSLRNSGFVNVPLSTFALSQAKLLLRLHYPSEGYQLRVLEDSCFLGWQNRPLFSVSSWH